MTEYKSITCVQEIIVKKKIEVFIYLLSRWWSLCVCLAMQQVNDVKYKLHSLSASFLIDALQ